MKKKYKIVANSGLNRFNKDLKEALEKGWEPVNPDFKMIAVEDEFIAYAILMEKDTQPKIPKPTPAAKMHPKDKDLTDQTPT